NGAPDQNHSGSNEHEMELTKGHRDQDIVTFCSLARTDQNECKFAPFCGGSCQSLKRGALRLGVLRQPGGTALPNWEAQLGATLDYGEAPMKRRASITPEAARP